MKNKKLLVVDVMYLPSDIADKSDKENYMYRHITPYQFENTSNTESTSSSSISTTSLPDNNNNNR